ncbi:TetR/AcrR family transcriptional regulator [Streptomyces sp. NPDC056390]|uniref:TetR/AcrR family transcriptional regulator n=1 Tax=Streptomyces sp. NPDC056390 TaxID=3345806 RepID=UPI0035E075A8
MTADPLATSPVTDSVRADRILAAARDLLLAWGYKRVTIDDIARRAKVGKGTVYLHWKTKETLFVELLRREFCEVLAAVAARVAGDAAGALPHRLCREVFTEHLRRPIALALHVGDSEMLGRLTPGGHKEPAAAEGDVHALLVRLVDVWRAHGLLTPALPADDQVYALDAVMTGYFSDLRMVPQAQEPSSERRADLLAHTIRATFEPAEQPDMLRLEDAAKDVLAVLARAQGEAD